MSARAHPLEFAPSIVRAHGYSDAHERPLVMERKGRGSWRTDPRRAWESRYIQLNPANAVSVLTLDVDNPERILDILNPFANARVLPEPSWTVVNPANGHGHPSWCLSRPVHTNLKSSFKPQRLLACVSDWYTKKAGADGGYSGILSRNPYAGRGGKTFWGRRKPYSLNELAERLPKGYRLLPRPVSNIGRNVGLFQAMMRFAGRRSNAEVPLFPVCEALNGEFDVPLPLSEVRSITKSVSRYRSKWLAQGKYRNTENQRRRGILSGKARRKRNAERDRRIVQMMREGATVREVAWVIGTSKSTVSRVWRGGSPPVPRTNTGSNSGAAA